ncbi:GNAT family N-acetyltransferase [Streptomyces hygroscopicus]|uniref:GNAT family N-acetyltransferase n=1 Tax=Streptomyces hygroscopicus TaxID=1912 RepID=UPI0034045E97
MASTEQPCLIREATTEDAAAVRELYGAGAVEEFTARLGDRWTAPGTRHYVTESDGRVVAAFALTALGRLRPEGNPRLMLHEIKIRPSFRGIGVAEDILSWLAGTLGVGTETELLALAPLGQRPASFDRFDLEASHQAFKWPVRKGHSST